MQIWPSQFIPYPTPDYNFANAASSIRTQMESGRFRQRRRFSEDQRFINVQWDLSGFEYDVFDSFVFNSLEQGNAWFQISLPFGMGYKTVIARIVDGKYNTSNKGVLNWVVTAQLELQQVPRMDAATLAFLLDPGFYIDDLEDSVSSLHTLVHTTLPDDLI